MSSKKTLILRKVGGFYQSFDEDALIISYLFGYKVINSRCGFPINAINKVLEKLEEKTINYTLKQEEEQTKDFKRKNNYIKYLEKSKAKENVSSRIRSIISKLENLDKKKLEDILVSIEGLMDED